MGGMKSNVLITIKITISIIRQLCRLINNDLNTELKRILNFHLMLKVEIIFKNCK